MAECNAYNTPQPLNPLSVIQKAAPAPAPIRKTAVPKSTSSMVTLEYPFFGEGRGIQVPLLPYLLSEKTHTAVGIQSDFRDSSAQTDPYTPDYYVPPGHKPEILTLMNLTHRMGIFLMEGAGGGWTNRNELWPFCYF